MDGHSTTNIMSIWNRQTIDNNRSNNESNICKIEERLQNGKNQQLRRIDLIEE
jgi:hypothetical protein